VVYHRAEKAHAGYPDFEHKKKAQKAFWLDDKQKPPWVRADLAAMAPGTVQLHIYSWKTKLTRYVQAGQTSEGNGAFSTNAMRRDDTFV